MSEKTIQKTPSGRIIRYDFARAICMLWIVGFWHMCSGYLGIKVHENSFLGTFTSGILAVFFYMSARLSSKAHIERFSDAWAYIKHRFIAIYPLYLISAATMIFIPFKNFGANLKLFLMSATCLNIFFPPMIKTLWFLTILLLFYLITPIFLSTLKTRTKILIALSIYAVLIVENLAFGQFDPRLVTYFPVYILGLFISQQTENNILKLRYFLISLPILILTLYLISTKEETSVFISLIFVFVKQLFLLSYIVFLLMICEWLSKIKPLYRIFYTISFTSTFAYLFHRQYFGLWKRFFNIFPIWLAYLVILPSLLVLSYFGQKLYTMLIKKIEKKN